MIRIKNLRKDKMVVIEIPVAVDGGQRAKRGVVDRVSLAGERKDSATIRPTLTVAKLTVPNTITLLPNGKTGDKSKPLPDTVRKAPDVLRKLNTRHIEIIQE